jgi:hypothetical protein
VGGGRDGVGIYEDKMCGREVVKKYEIRLRMHME